MSRMLWSSLVVGVVGMFAAVLGRQLVPARQAATSDAWPLEGTWVCVSQEVNGEGTAPDNAREKLRLVVHCDELLFVNGKRETRMAYALDLAASPTTIDMWEKRPELHGATPVHHGIFSIDGDTLRICSGLCRVPADDDRKVVTPESERPTEFSAGPGSSCILTVFKRQAP